MFPLTYFHIGSSFFLLRVYQEVQSKKSLRTAKAAAPPGMLFEIVLLALIAAVVVYFYINKLKSDVAKPAGEKKHSNTSAPKSDKPTFKMIKDKLKTIEEVQSMLEKAGLESSNLIVGIDYTKSNEYNGKRTSGGRSLHALGNIPNPYQLAISVLGRTLEPFDEDHLM